MSKNKTKTPAQLWRECTHNFTRKTLDCAARIAGLPGGYSDDAGERAIDILTDVRHYCAVHGLDWDAVLQSSDNHFDYETSDLQREEEGQ